MVRVSILGTGYVGLCTGVVFAERGHEVTLVDIDPEKVQAVEAGTAPFHEPGIDEALKEQVSHGRLDATTDTQAAIQDSTITFLCVGTPQDASGDADLSQIEAAARDIGDALEGVYREHTVVTKSTVPPGTTRDLVATAVRQGAGPEERGRVRVAMNPEFLREGSALEDSRAPDKIVIGSDEESTIPIVEELYEGVDAPIVRTDATTAELIKYANNAFLATKITFANEMANLADALGADWNDIADAIGLDHRISGDFFRAGVGFGGSCFPKDVRAIAHLAREEQRPSRLLDAVLEANEAQPLRAVDLLEDEIGDLDGQRVALLGLSFKPGTDDVRNTRAVPILDELEARGAQVTCHDPLAADAFLELRPEARIVSTAEKALEDAHGAILQTAWPEYARLDPDTLEQLMATPVLVDGRRGLDEDAFEGSNVTYRAIGKGTP